LKIKQKNFGYFLSTLVKFSTNRTADSFFGGWKMKLLAQLLTLLLICLVSSETIQFQSFDMNTLTETLLQNSNVSTALSSLVERADITLLQGLKGFSKIKNSTFSQNPKLLMNLSRKSTPKVRKSFTT
jgi:hypothetical protein